jgi:hypothetical protein
MFEASNAAGLRRQLVVKELEIE